MLTKRYMLFLVIIAWEVKGVGTLCLTAGKLLNEGREAGFNRGRGMGQGDAQEGN